MLRPICCLQINLQHCTAASVNLAAVTKKLNAQIVLVQEPWLHKGKLCNPPAGLNGFTCSTNANHQPRAAIFASEDLQAWLRSDLSSPELCVIQTTKLSKNNRATLIASMYIPGDGDSVPGALERLCQYAQDHNLDLLLGGDVNAHHTHWGSRAINARGEEVLAFLNTTNLVLCNRGAVPTFNNSRWTEVIDVTLATPNLCDRVEDWKVCVSIPSLSDHAFIAFNLATQTAPNSLLWRRNVRNTNWVLFDEALKTSLQARGGLPQPRTCEQVTEVATVLQDCVKEAFNVACPLKAYKGKKSAPWWNPDLGRLRQKARQLQHKANLTQLAEDRARFREAIHAFKREVRRAKDAKWKAYCQELEEAKPTSRLVKALTLDKISKLAMVKKADGSLTNDPGEALDTMLGSFFPAMPPAGMTTDHGWDGEVLASTIVREDLIQRAANSFRPFKAPGPDGIQPALLQAAVRNANFCRKLCELIRASLQLGFIPKCWTGANVCFIPKPGKGDYQAVRSFRPISLTSFFLKLMEKLVLWRLLSVELKNKPLSPNQHAFRPGRSTESALHGIVDKIERALLGQEFALGVFLDIEGAFDNVLFSSFSLALRTRKTHSCIVRWIMYMVTQREVTATLLGHQRTVAVCKGGPQGGVLTPLLWNLVIDDLLSGANNPLLKVGYADDVTAIVSGPSPNTLWDIQTAFIRRAEEWADRNGLRLSESKTCAVMFTHKRKWKIPPLRLYGHDVAMVTQVRCLGVTLDHKLSWSTHILSKTRKALGIIAQLKRAVGTTWGLTPARLWWIYTAIVRPALTYACMIWAGATQLQTIQRALTQAQGRACRMILSAPPSTPFEGMNAFLDLTPLDIHIRGEAARTARRLMDTGVSLRRHAVLGSKLVPHAELCCRDLEKAGCLAVLSDETLPTLNLRQRFKTLILPRDSVENPDRPGELHCFTDGSMINGHAGFGVCIVRDRRVLATHSQYTGTSSTVFHNEVLAISSCAAELLAQNVVGQIINFHSDSQAALFAINRTAPTSTTVTDCVRLLNLLGAANTVNLSWIPGHSGFAGNELADRLAKAGTAPSGLGPHPLAATPKAVISARLKLWMREQHLTRWTAMQDCRQSRKAVPQPTRTLRNFILKLTRSDARAITMTLCGHGCFTRHRWLQGSVDSELCHFCHTEPENAEHFVCVCPFFRRHRLSTLGPNPSIAHITRPDNLAQLLRFLRCTRRAQVFPTEEEEDQPPAEGQHGTP